MKISGKISMQLYDCWGESLDLLSAKNGLFFPALRAALTSGLSPLSSHNCKHVSRCCFVRCLDLNYAHSVYSQHRSIHPLQGVQRSSKVWC